MVLNPTNDKSNGYAFNVSAAGVQEESQIFNGDSFDATWDQKWFAEVHHEPGKWSLEIAIPFRSLRYKAGQDQWSINFIRIDNRINEYSSWVFIPRNLAIGHLAYTRPLRWEVHPTVQGGRYAIIPSVTTSVQRSSNKATAYTVTPSVDAKLALGSSLALDLTVNPDFSQVEVDATQANLTRFELYFPERRQFFIENNDLFTDFGNDDQFTSDSRPFYTRRIGLSFNPLAQAYEPVPILGGAKLSGKAGKNTRLGLLSVQTASQIRSASNAGSEQIVPSQNYTVATLQQRLFGRSNVAGIFVNRQAFGTTSNAAIDFRGDDYNRVAGLDVNLLSQDGKWNGKLYHHSSFTGGVNRKGYDPGQNSHGSFLHYTSRRFETFVGHTFVGKDYNPEAGFLPRSNFLNFRSSFRYYIYPSRKDSPINAFTPTLFYSVFYHPDYNKTDQTLVMANTLRFRNRSLMRLWLYDERVRLFSDFDPSRSGSEPLKAGTSYHYRYAQAAYQSDNTTAFFWAIDALAGQYYTGNRWSVSGNVNYKAQPWGIFSINYRFTNLRLPQPQLDNQIWTIGPRADLSFSRSLFFTGLLQYNSLSRNLNAFAKLQWRYRPLSDLFLVYQDNYDSLTGQLKTRSAIAKMVYWF